MENTQTAVADPSPAFEASNTFEAPTDPKANLEWRTTGKLPDGHQTNKPPKDDSTTSKPASADKTAKTESASAPDTKQETAKQHATAEDRLSELLADLKRAGLSPSELKTFKREAQKAATETTPVIQAQPKGLEAPVKPKEADFETWEKFQDAKDKYVEDFADYRAKVAVQEDRQARAAEAQNQMLAAKVADAKTRYGDQTEVTIGEATRAILAKDSGVPPVLQQFMGESRVLVDVLYVLGSKDGDVAAFIELARTDPGAAIRKFTLMEQLVEQELAKGVSGSAAAGSADKGAAGETERGADGKFVSQTPPAKKKPAAPPPPDELSTRGSAPPDAIEAAVRNGDFRAFKAEDDRRDIARRRGA